MVRGNFFLVAALFVAIIALAHGQTTSNKKDSKAAKAAAAAVVKEEPPAEPLNDMAQENSVQIHFMDYKRAEFLEVLPKVKTAIADSLSKYCAEHASKCGVEGSVNFTENDIGFIGNSDKERFPEEGRFVIPRLFATLPSENAIAVGDDDKVGDNEDLKAVARPVLEEFLAEHSQDIGKEGGVAIAYVNDKLVYPPRDQLSNILIVSISCGITLILIIVNLICQRISSKKSKREFLAKAASEQSRPLLRPMPFVVQPAVPQQQQQAAQSSSMLQAAAPQHTHSSYYTPSQSNRSDSVDIRMSRINAISRHDSFDQKLDVRTAGGGGGGTSTSSKRRKRHRATVNGGAPVPIVGNVGQGIGSPRNITETITDARDNHLVDYRGGGNANSAYRLKGSLSNERLNDVRPQQPVYYQGQGYPSYPSSHGGGRGPAQHLSSSSLNKNEINIPIERIDHRYEQQSSRSEYKNYTLQRIDINEYADPKVAYRLASSERL